MYWYVSYRADPRALPLAARHYNRRRPHSRQFVPPGRCIVLLTKHADALWVSSWQKYVRHAWPGAWVCSCFRNESPHLSSELIHQAVAVTRFFWGPPPPAGMVTFVNPDKVRKKRHPGHCFRKAGWSPCGFTRSGLVVLHILPQDMPAPQNPCLYGLLFGPWN
jgi:hypothetical protein